METYHCPKCGKNRAEEKREVEKGNFITHAHNINIKGKNEKICKSCEYKMFINGEI